MKKIEDIKLAIVVSEFNTTITSSLKKSAINYFISEKGNLDNIDIYNEHRRINNALVKNTYNWEGISDNILNIYKELLN